MSNINKEAHEMFRRLGYFDTEGRGFSAVPMEFLKNHAQVLDVILPKRGSGKSAGYDFVTPNNVEIKAGEKALIWTDVCAFMEDDEVLNLHVRSSVGIKKGLILANITGIIDSDYFANPDNFGNIGICLKNTTNETVYLKQGERIAQGIFTKYLITNDDEANGDRTGGIGSTGN